MSVLGASYPLESFTGTAISDKTWIETSTTTTITTYGHTSSDDTRWYTPWSSISVEQTHTKRDQLVLAYEDGMHGQWGFTNSALAFVPGHTVTLIARPMKDDTYDCLLGDVHQTARLERFDFSAAHSIAARRIWIVTSVLGAAGFVWGWMAAMVAYLVRYAPGTPIPPITPDPFLWGVGLAIAAVVALVPCALAGSVVPGARTFLFNRRYLPGIRSFCPQQGMKP